MARAKHRAKIAQREYEAFVRKHERQMAHEALLIAHKEFKKTQK
jgi:hypothetical protein